MKAFVAWSLLGLAAVGMVGTIGCGANIPDVKDIDENPQADKDAMAKSMQDMADRMQDSATAGGQPAPNVDINKQVDQSAGGN